MLLNNKRILILGMANKYSIAAGIAAAMQRGVNRGLYSNEAE